MSKYLIYISLYLVLLCYYSCSSPAEQAENKNYIELKTNILTIKDTIEIKISDSTINSGSLNYFLDEKDGLYIYSEEKFENFYKLFFYNLLDSSNNFTVKLMKEGPQGVDKLFFPVLVKAIDTFYVLNWKSEIINFNSAGHIKKNTPLILPVLLTE